MAVVITDTGTPSGTFRINGKLYNKHWMALDRGANDIAIVNVNDNRAVIQESTNYAEYQVNGVTYGTLELTLEALTSVVFEQASGAGGGSVNVWGDITGTLSNQTDLQAALDAKMNTGTFAAWADITGKPTTIAGFGITDAFTQTDADGLYLPLAGKAADADLLDGLNGATAGTANTVALRDGSGDVRARLFRSDYDVTNGTVGFIMTQIDTDSNNYIRPTTPAQFRTAVIDGHYLPLTGTAANASLLDGVDSSAFVRSNTADTVSGVLTFTARPAFNASGAPISVSSTTMIDNLNADMVDGIEASQFLRSDQSDSTSGSLTAASFITGNWTIDQSGTSLKFYYNGAAVFEITSAGAMNIEGTGTFNTTVSN